MNAGPFVFAQARDAELFEVLRRVECAHPHCPRLGRSARPAEDPVRLAQTPGLGFTAREVDDFDDTHGTRPPQLRSFVLGLFGPQGPLPLHMTEYALDRQRNAKDTTLVAFGDIFHHRMLSLFYRAWADAQPTVEWDRPGEDRFRTYVGALIGMATPHLQARDALPDQAKRFFAGRLVPQARNSEGLQALIEQCFGVAVRVIECVAEWMRLPAQSHLRMGGDMAVLGHTAVIGSHVRGAQHRFRLRLGPLARSEFDRFLPGGEALRQLRALVRTYVGDEMAWDVQLVLRKAQVPTIRMGQTGRVGMNTWLGHYAGADDADPVVLAPMVSA